MIASIQTFLEDQNHKGQQAIIAHSIGIKKIKGIKLPLVNLHNILKHKKEILKLKQLKTAVRNHSTSIKNPNSHFILNHTLNLAPNLSYPNTTALQTIFCNQIIPAAQTRCQCPTTINPIVKKPPLP